MQKQSTLPISLPVTLHIKFTPTHLCRLHLASHTWKESMCLFVHSQFNSRGCCNLH
uniref:Uncharacterized protein n=1 Tax=Anguilla anguilla TaxID=7936 RepID=A0A0E9XYZ6_ANGAN